MRDAIQVPAFNKLGERMTPSERIFATVVEVLQEAEEIGGPEGKDYDTLMEKIAEDVRGRIEAHRISRIPPLCRKIANAYRELARNEEDEDMVEHYHTCAEELEGCRSVEEAANMLWEAFETMSVV